MVAIRQQLVGSLGLTSGTGNTHTSITVHQTGNTSRGANAAAHANLQSTGNVRSASWHWTVDDTEAVQSFPYNVKCWHAGSTTGNNTSIGIEVCVNSDGNYVRALQNAAELVAHVMAQTGVPIRQVVQHHHWSGKNCPEQIRSAQAGIGWQRFVEMIASATGQPGKTDTPQEEDMIELIRVLYRLYLGRGPTDVDLLAWSDSFSGKTPAEAHALFKQSKAEGGTVLQAYATFLGRSPSGSELAAWADHDFTIAQVWNGISGSAEAQA